jgi:hypothetical protein
MTASPLQTRPSKVGTPPNHDKLTDRVLEMRARASVVWGGWRPSWTEVPTFMPERASHVGGASQFDQELSTTENNCLRESRLLGLIAASQVDAAREAFRLLMEHWESNQES